MNTISVIMCVYDGDNDIYFKLALESLIPNKKEINEIVLIINGKISVKKEEIIKELKQILPINEYKLEKNKGLSKALNIAVKLAKYDWLARFDSDDLCTKDRFKLVQKNISKYGSEYDVMGTYIKEFSDDSSNTNIRRVPLKIEDIRKRLIFSNPMNHVTVFFKKELVLKNSKPNFYPLIDGFEDYALWTKLLGNKVRFRNFEEVNVLVRTGTSMIKRRGGFEYIKKEIKLRFYINKFIKKNQIPLNLIIMILRILVFSLDPSIKNIIYKVIRKLQ